MPTGTDFLTYSIGTGANVATQAEWASDPAQNVGFGSGIASSAKMNKVWRQAAMWAAVLGNFTSNGTNTYIYDDGNLGELLANFQQALFAPFFVSFDLASPPSTDIQLSRGQKCSITFENVANIPLHIATVAGFYKITMAVTGNSSTNTDLHLQPNNATYSGAFNSWQVECYDEQLTGFGSATTPCSFVNVTGGVPGFLGSLPIVSYNGAIGGIGGGSPDSSFYMDIFGGPQGADTVNDRGPFILEILAVTNQAAKSIKYSSGIIGGPAQGFALWNDTTTPWNSLGTLIIANGSSYSGYALVERLV